MTEESRVKRSFLCPHCGESLRVDVEVIGLRGRLTPEEVQQRRQQPSGPDFTTRDEQMLEAARRAGMLEPFERTVRAAQPHSIPKDMELFFVSIMRRSERRLIPRRILDLFRAEFPDRHLTFIASLTILTVLADKAIVMFAPYGSIRPTKVGKAGRLSVAREELLIDDMVEKVGAWIQTKHGHVTGQGALLEALREPYQC